MTEANAPMLSKALEDYLETIERLRRDHRVVRVKDIARSREVKMSSVTMAMKRLAELRLVSYSQREYIDLTPAGEEAARRVLARHGLLSGFFRDVLELDLEQAERDACAMEHDLSDEAMERLTRFLEYVERCPEGREGVIDGFHGCRAVHPDAAARLSDGPCPRGGACRGFGERRGRRSVADLKPGERGVVTQVTARGALRQRLLDLGLLPGHELVLERVAGTGDPLWLKAEGFQLSLRRSEAESILISG